MNAESYRAIMRHQAGAVAVIAVGSRGARTGLTATAVCSLSDTPPTILACVNKAASAHDPIADNRCFSVNLLARDQQDLAAVFSGKGALKGEDRFTHGDWTTLETGAPVLDGALATLDCRLTERHDSPTHSIFVGAVADGCFNGDAVPLLYFRGDFWDLTGGA